MKKLFLFTALSAIIFSGCSNENSPTEPKEPTPPIQLTRNEAEMTAIINDFSFSLFKEVYQDEDEKNIIISPLSAALALSMTNNGATGNTQKEMMTMLGFEDYSRDEMNAYFKKMVDALLTMDEKTDIRIANAIWIKENFGVKQPFIDNNRTYYNATMDYLNFLDMQKSLTIINQWCADNTENKIDEILDRLDPTTIMVLANALYFKGVWKYQFDKDNTYDGQFRNEDNSYSSVKMMEQECEINYTKNDVFTIGELPYGNESFSMIVLLPHYDISMEEAMKELTPENWGKWMKELKPVEDLPVTLPRFEIEYEKKLNDILQNMGMIDAFDINASFDDICDNSELCVSLVKQKAIIEVNEEGTEAAAVTVVVIVENALPDTPSLNVNRPFIFAIREKSTEAILFVGKVGEL